MDDCVGRGVSPESPDPGGIGGQKQGPPRLPRTSSPQLPSLLEDSLPFCILSILPHALTSLQHVFLDELSNRGIMTDFSLDP